MKDALLQPSMMPDFKDNFRLYFFVANFDKLFFKKKITQQRSLCSFVEERSLKVCV